MKSTLYTALSSISGSSNPTELLAKLSSMVDTSSPEECASLASAIPKLFSAFSTLSIKDFDKYASLVGKIFDLLDDSNKFAIIWLLLKNVSFQYYLSLSEPDFPPFFRLLLKIYAFVVEHFSDLSESKLYSSSIPILLFKNVVMLVGYTGYHSYPEKVLPQGYPNFRECLMAIMKTNKIREVEFYYLSKSDSLMEWLGFFTVLADLREAMTAKSPSIADFIGNLLYTSFNDFLCKVVGGKEGEYMTKGQMAVKWMNDIIIWVGTAINEINIKVEKTAKNINERYLRKFCQNEAFRIKVTEQLIKNSAFVKLALFGKLDFTVAPPKSKKGGKSKRKQRSKIQEGTSNEISSEASISLSKMSSEPFVTVLSSQESFLESFEEEKFPPSSISKEPLGELLDSDSSTDEVFNQLSELDNTLPNLTSTEIYPANDTTYDDVIHSLHEHLEKSSLISPIISSSSLYKTAPDIKKVKVAEEEIEEILEKGTVTSRSPAKALDISFLSTEFNAFATRFVTERNNEAKIKLEPFYKHFFHKYLCSFYIGNNRLEVILKNGRFPPFRICPWSNSNETYTVSGEEVCLSICTGFEYPPVI